MNKLQSKVAVEAIGAYQLENALGISHKTAKSIIHTYHALEPIRYEQNPMDACDQKLLLRAGKMIGVKKACDLVGSNVDGLLRSKQERKFAQDMLDLEDRMATRFRKELQAWQSLLLAELREGSQTPLPQPLSAAPSDINPLVEGVASAPKTKAVSELQTSERQISEHLLPPAGVTREPVAGEPEPVNMSSPLDGGNLCSLS